MSDPRSGRLRKEEEGEWLEGPWWPCWGLGCSPEDGRGLVEEGCGQTHGSGRGTQQQETGDLRR